jgi:hypothetical protein
MPSSLQICASSQHAGDRMLAAGPVVPNRRGNAVIGAFVQDHTGQTAVAGPVDILVRFHDPIAMEPVNQDIALRIVRGRHDDGLRIAVVLDAAVEQLHLDARHTIRVVVVGRNAIQRDPVHGRHGLIRNAHMAAF